MERGVRKMKWCGKCQSMVPNFHKHHGPADYVRLADGTLICMHCRKPVKNNNVICGCKP